MALNTTNEEICSEDTKKKHQYFCPSYHESVHLKIGRKKNSHFSHYPISSYLYQEEH